MRFAVAFAAGGLALAMSLPAAAQEFKFEPPNLFGQKKPAPKPPAVDWNAGPPADAPRRSEPSVVCGMTLIPADPTIDPKIRVAPKDDRVKYAMRVVPPTICRPR